MNRPERLWNRDFTLLFSGQLVSSLGNTFGGFALAWLAYDITGSKAAMGVLAGAYFFPQLAARLVAGPFVDRWNWRKTMIAVDWLRAAIWMVPVALAALDQLAYWPLVAISVVAGSLEPFFWPANMALVPELVPSLQLVRANSFNEGGSALAGLVGPGLAGLFVAAHGAPAAILLDGITFAVSALTLTLISDPQRRKHPTPSEVADAAPVGTDGAAPTATTGRRHWLVEFREGLRFYRAYPALLWLAGFVSISNFSFGATGPLWLPFAKDTLLGSAFEVGLLQSAFPAGFLIGTALVAWLGEPRRRRPRMLGGLDGRERARRMRPRDGQQTMSRIRGREGGGAVWMVNASRTSKATADAASSERAWSQASG